MSDFSYPSVYYNFDRDKQMFVVSDGREEGSITGAHIRVTTLPKGTPGDARRISVDIDFAGEAVIIAAVRKLMDLVPEAASPLQRLGGSALQAASPVGAASSNEFDHVDENLLPAVKKKAAKRKMPKPKPPKKGKKR